MHFWPISIGTSFTPTTTLHRHIFLLLSLCVRDSAAHPIRIHLNLAIVCCACVYAKCDYFIYSVKSMHVYIWNSLNWIIACGKCNLVLWAYVALNCLNTIALNQNGKWFQSSVFDSILVLTSVDALSLDAKIETISNQIPLLQHYQSRKAVFETKSSNYYHTK